MTAITEMITELESSNLQKIFVKNYQCLTIAYYTRSGSFLFHSLLDGHSKILTLPPWGLYLLDHHSLDNLVAIMDDFARNPHLDSDFSNFVNTLLQPTYQWTDDHSSGVHHYLGENADIPIDTPVKPFVRCLSWILVYLRKNNLVSKKSYLVAIAVAYNLCKGRKVKDLEDASNFLYHLHTPNLAILARLKNIFQNIFLLQTIRNPLSGLNAHVQHHLDRRDETTHVIFHGALVGGKVPKFLKETECLAVKMEYLHIFGEKYIRKILEAIGLEWEDICLKSTIDGELFWWNKEGSLISGLNPKFPLGLCNKGMFDCQDKLILSYFYKDFYSNWNYPMCSQQNFIPLLKKVKQISQNLSPEDIQAVTTYEKYIGNNKRIDIFLLISLLSLMNLFKNNEYFKERAKVIKHCLLLGAIESQQDSAKYMPLVDESFLEVPEVSCDYVQPL